MRDTQSKHFHTFVVNDTHNNHLKKNWSLWRKQAQTRITNALERVGVTYAGRG
jgi:hypothetical protein